MCYKTKQTASAQHLQERFNAELIEPELVVESEKYFVFEKPMAPIITNLQPNYIQTFQFGLLPDKLAKTANARIETITDRFRHYIHQKCLVLVNGFYEKNTLFTLPNNEPFALAGLWSTQKSGEGYVQTFTIITTEAQGTIADYHNRMPVALKRNIEMDWLLGKTTAKLHKDFLFST